jgi:hypothetical protein
MRLGLGLGLGVDNAAGDGGGADYPIARRDLLQEDEFIVLLEDGSDIVITFGTFDSLDLENGDFLLQEDADKLIIQAN